MSNTTIPEPDPETDSEENTFKPDYKIAKLSAVGIIGFIAGCIFMFYPDLFSSTKKSIFHEMKYLPRQLAAITIEGKADSLRKVINLKKDSIVFFDSIINLKNAAAAVASANKKKLSNENLKDSTVEKTLSDFRVYYEDASDADTSAFIKLNNAFHFKIDTGRINKWNEAFINEGYSWKDSTDYYFKDPRLPLSIKGRAIFSITEPGSDISFVTKYPAAGVWLFLILIFCSFSFIAISTSNYLKNKVLTLFKDNSINGLSEYDYYLVCLCTLIALGVLLIVLNLSFNDEEVIKNIYFIRSINSSLVWVRLLGYVAGSFCLAGFIHTAAMLSYFAKSIKKQTASVTEKSKITEENKRVNAAPEDIAAAQAYLKSEEEKQQQKKVFYGRLLDIFQTYFMLSAAILSLMVLCTGGLFSAVNSLDFMKLLSDDWGYSPVRPDFIYLYGALHTIILLLVYVPAKMRFSEIDIEVIEASAAKDTMEGKWYNFLKNPFSHLKDLMIVSSPLLASLVQSLFEIIFNK